MDLKDHPVTEEPDHPVMKCTINNLKLLARCISAIQRLDKVQFVEPEHTIVKHVIRNKLVAIFDTLFSGGEIIERDLFDLEYIIASLME